MPNAAAIQARLTELDAKRANIIDAFVDGIYDKVERDRRLALLTKDRAKAQASLDVTGPLTFYLKPTIQWDGSPAEVNAQLRLVWTAIVLNGGMHPHRAAWRPTEEYDEDGPR